MSTMDDHETYEIDVCTDCFIWTANADDSGFCDCGETCNDLQHHNIRQSSQLSSNETVIDWRETTREFSNWPCEACGTQLRGQRHEVTVLIQATEDEDFFDFENQEDYDITEEDIA